MAKQERSRRGWGTEGPRLEKGEPLKKAALWSCGEERVVPNSGLARAQGNVIAWVTRLRFCSRVKQ